MNALFFLVLIVQFIFHLFKPNIFDFVYSFSLSVCSSGIIVIC